MAGDGTSTEDREMDKRSGSVEPRVSENGAAAERRVGEGSWFDVASESVDNLETGVGRMARRGRLAAEEVCNG